MGCGEKLVDRGMTLFQKMQVAVLGLRSPGRFLHVLEELSQIIAFGRRHSFEMNANSLCGPGAGHYSAQHKSFYPYFSVGYPEGDCNFGPRLDRLRSFDQTSTCAGVGKIAPDRSRDFIDPEFDRDETFDSRVATAVASPVGSEQIGFKRRSRGSRSRNWLRGRSCGGSGLPGRRAASLDLTHGRQQRRFPLFSRGFTVGLQQLSDMPDKVRIGQYLRPVSSCCHTHRMHVIRS